MNKQQIEWMKEHINPAKSNTIYTEWLQSDKSLQFRLYVIHRAESI